MPVLSWSLLAVRDGTRQAPVKVPTGPRSKSHPRVVRRQPQPSTTTCQTPERAQQAIAAPRHHATFQLVSGLSPNGPTLRANPFPEVTDLTCRLPLPTFIYRLEAVHLGDRMRIWVRTGVKVRTPAPWIFKCLTGAARTSQETRRSFGTRPSLRPTRFTRPLSR